MNELQRALVFFTAFSLIVGGVSGPAHGASIREGMIAGIGALFFVTGLAFCTVWIIDGAGGVVAMADKVLGRDDRR